MTWDDSLSVGSPEIDQHHRQIFDELNSFFGCMMHGEGMEGALRMIDVLSRTMEDHFREEESHMGRAGYPELAQHRAQHQDFLSRFAGHRRDVESGRPDAAKALFEYSIGWWNGHIQTQDKAMARFARAKRAA